MTQVKIYSASPSDMSPPVDDKSFCTDFVLATDYQELKEKMAALACENAALKQSKPSLKAMMSALDAFYADEEVPESAMLIAYNILRGDVETPATDAFIAEQQAIGVEKAADELIALAERSRSDAPVSSDHTHSAALFIKLIAQQLREGAK